MSIWVLFDLDGTLVDNSEGITKSTQFALDSYGYPNQPMETLKKFIGPPLHESFMEFYGFSKEQAFEAVDRYRVRYKEKGVYENRLYPGMKELLEALRRCRCEIERFHLKTDSVHGEDLEAKRDL